MRAPITSTKHYVQTGIDSVMAGTVKSENLVQGRRSVDVTSAFQVVEGSVVKAVYVEVWILAGSQQPGSFTFTIEKIPANQDPPTFLQMATFQDYPNKKNILYTTQGVSPDANGNPVPIYRGWVKIPRGKQRIGLFDRILWTLSANVEAHTFCGMATYKDYN